MSSTREKSIFVPARVQPRSPLAGVILPASYRAFPAVGSTTVRAVSVPSPTFATAVPERRRNTERYGEEFLLF